VNKHKIAFIVALYYLFISSASAESKTVYLSTLEDSDSKVEVVSCNQERSSCTATVAAIDKTADIQIVGNEFKAKTVDKFDDSVTEEIFVPVEVSYFDGAEYKKQKGFLQKYLLSEKKLSAFFEIEAEENSRMPAAEKNKNTKKKKTNLNKATNHVYELIGECAIEPATKLPKKLPKENIFDALVYNRVKKHKLPAIYNEKGQQITHDELVTIDALARTIYGEMGKCFKKGLQYPIAAALVAVNRYDNKPRFKEWTSSYTKRKVASVPPLTKIVTTPEKFNNWMKKNGDKPNGPLHHSLCPPRAVNKPFWKANMASQDQVDIWKNAVRIATEAVMFPSKFKARSPAMKNINFYTSGLGQYNNYLQVFPFVNDRPLEHFDCIEMWKEPNKK
jgi:hypothetical protein